jgi:hypothetical protein
MRTKSYLQVKKENSTLEAIAGLVKRANPSEILFCFAYATVSGFAEFKRRVGPKFWSSIPTRWLIGIDYGRSHPGALKALAKSPNATVRVFDGEAVVQQPGFAPNVNFHMKVCFLTDNAAGNAGMIAGSGNFSRSGLVSGYECGIALFAQSLAEDSKVIRKSRTAAEDLWESATPLEDIFEAYDERWLPTRKAALPGKKVGVDESPNGSPFKSFWIQAGYVTPNRGKDKPGNQIDLPRGVHRFFRFKTPAKPKKNSVLGNVTFLVKPEPVTRTVRLGNNLMEKITLPVPETYGYGAYDGKVLEFKRRTGGYKLVTHEFEEFMDLASQQANGITAEMDSGRLYGYR